MERKHEKQHPTQRMADGVKTALFVCVIGFIALMANRALVAPGGASPVESPAAPSMIAPDGRTPTPLPADETAIATPRSPADDGAAAPYEGGDNHPPTF